ncbi:MAG: hypothetical protein HYX72_12790 [Acidobacteria bacterium]|nr:hypothetical protein [Acidobacteriota bacterium]
MTELECITSKALRSRYYTPGTGKTAVEILFSRHRKDALPELENFTRRWKMRFPVPPSIEVPLEHDMTSPWAWPVVIRHLKLTETLVLEIRPEIGKGIVLAFIGGAVWHSMKKRRDGTMLTSRKHGQKREMHVSKKSNHQLLVEISLPANKEDVLREVDKHLAIHSPHFQLAEKPDKKISLDREYYALMFQAIDLRKRGKRGLKLADIAARFWPDRQKDARSVRDLAVAFSELATRFDIPR